MMDTIFHAMSFAAFFMCLWILLKPDDLAGKFEKFVTGEILRIQGENFSLHKTAATAIDSLNKAVANLVMDITRLKSKSQRISHYHFHERIPIERSPLISPTKENGPIARAARLMEKNRL